MLELIRDALSDIKRKSLQGKLLNKPAKLPFIDAVKARFNVRVDTSHEEVLLATYEPYWALRSALGMIAGEERKFLMRLAKNITRFYISICSYTKIFIGKGNGRGY